MLHKSTRDACGIKLKNNIVIIDEAHNLLDTISNIHSVQINGTQVNKVVGGVGWGLDGCVVGAYIVSC